MLSSSTSRHWSNMPKANIAHKDDTSSSSDVKTPTTMKPLPAEIKTQKDEEMSPGTRADFATFLNEHRSKIDDAACLDKTHPSVVHQSISSSAWIPDTPMLDYSARTWLDWDRSLRTSIGMYGFLLLHLEPSYLPPAPSTEPVAFCNWKMNDKAVCSFMWSKMSAIEQDFVKDPSLTASNMYYTLKTHHKQRGPTTQLTMIADALAIDFQRTVPLDQTVQRIRAANDAIWAMGAPSAEIFLSLLLVRALKKNYPVLYRDIDNSLASAMKQSPFPSSAIINRIAREQIDPKEPDVSTEAHVATQSASKSHLHCPNSNCGREGHTLRCCVKEGGGMAGKTVGEARAKYKEDQKAKSNPTPSVAVAEAHFSTLTALSTSPITSIIDAQIHSSMMAADISEYEASLLLEDPTPYAAVDWRSACRGDIGFEAIVASPLPSAQRISQVGPDSPYLSDSCASIHISCERSDFISLRPLSTPRSVRGLGGSTVEATGIGAIKIKVSKGSFMLLEPALFIPTSMVRLVSVALLAKAGFVTSFDFPHSEIRNTCAGNMLIATGEIILGRNVYKLNHLSIVHPSTKSSNHTPSEDHAYLSQSARIPSLDTWHRRLGHVNNQAILDMATKGLAVGMPVDLSIHLPVCTCCILGKQKRNVVPKVCEGPKSDRPLKKVYIDLCGPHLLSSSKNKYSVDIIDDYSGFPWSFGAKSKDSAYDIVIAWANQEQVRTGKRIVYINIDRGELRSERFDRWCAEWGISVTFSAPDTSAQNGRGERIHLTLMDQAQAMRLSCNLPPNQWDEFMATAAYTRARTASRRTGMTPYELYEGKKPDLSHLREIGCKAFVLQPNNPKIGPRGEEFILIGYAHNSKAYRCYHQPTRRVVESFHVKFVERKDEEERSFHPGRIINITQEPGSRPVSDSQMGIQEVIKTKPGPSEVSKTPVDPAPDVSHELGPYEVQQTPVETAAKVSNATVVDPEPRPSEVKRTPVKTATTIKDVEDEDEWMRPTHLKRVSKPTEKKVATMQEQTGRAARKAKRVE